MKRLTVYEKTENKFIRELLKKVSGNDQQKQIDLLIHNMRLKLRQKKLAT